VRSTTARARFVRANLVGGGVGVAICAWLLARAPTNALTTLLGSIDDKQARALFAGHWDLPLKDLAIEAFKIDGHYETYFGVWPAVLRMPVLAVTHRFDGRMTGPSMLLALVVALWASGGIQWQLRSLLQDAGPGAVPAPVGRGEWWATAVFQAALGGGSIATFLASRPLAYHEMEMWGIAGGLASAYCLLRYVRAPSLRRAGACSFAATITLLSRPSVGFGVLASFGFVWLVAIFRRHDSVRLVLGFAGAALVPLVLYGAMNVARFGSPFTLPLQKQVFTSYDKQRQAVLAANGGSLFGAKFVPTTLLQYARPDAVRFGRGFPFVNFPHERAHVVGHVVFDTLDRSSSLPASMPGFCALALLGAFLLLRGARPGYRRARALLWPIVIGGVLGTGFVLTIAFVANRYLADFMPPLVVLAIVGLRAVIDSSGGHRRRCVQGAVVLLFLLGAWISIGLAVVYQRNLQPGDPDYGRGVPAALVVGRRSNNI
jgi:uncharacterized membrane protein YdcZ (DUF606 family)